MDNDMGKVTLTFDYDRYWKESDLKFVSGRILGWFDAATCCLGIYIPANVRINSNNGIIRLTAECEYRLYETIKELARIHYNGHCECTFKKFEKERK